MPLPPLPPSNTPRLYIKYTNYQRGHLLVVHLPLTATDADAAAVFNASKSLLAGVLHTSDSVSGANYSAAGTNISFPLSVSGVAGSSTTALPAKQEALQLTVTGRSFDGRKVRVGVFTPYFPIATYGHRASGISGGLAPLYSFLTGSALGARSISGGVVQWNNYVNLGYNDHWVGELRSNAA